MRTGIILGLLIFNTVSYANRKPEKCGLAIAARARRAHKLSLRVARVPNGCGEVHMPSNYSGIQGPYGSEIWQNDERLVWALDTTQAKMVDPPLKEAKKDPVRTLVTTEQWRHGIKTITTKEFLQ